MGGCHHLITNDTYLNLSFAQKSKSGEEKAESSMVGKIINMQALEINI